MWQDFSAKYVRELMLESSDLRLKFKPLSLFTCNNLNRENMFLLNCS